VTKPLAHRVQASQRLLLDSVDHQQNQTSPASYQPYFFTSEMSTRNGNNDDSIPEPSTYPYIWTADDSPDTSGNVSTISDFTSKASMLIYWQEPPSDLLQFKASEIQDDGTKPVRSRPALYTSAPGFVFLTLKRNSVDMGLRE